MAVELVVVHAISLPPGQFGGPYIDQLFLGQLAIDDHPCFKEIAGLRVSAHFLIDRQGRLTQYVPIGQRAWHAGASRWHDREHCNDFSIGVELEGDDQTPFQEIQYQHLAFLFRALQTRLPLLGEDRLAGHQEIAPGRKWDPGPFFDWSHLRRVLTTATHQPAWPLVWE